MTIARIAQVVAEAPAGTVPFGLREPLLERWNGRVCEGSKFHSPTPLLVRLVFLSDMVTMMVSDGPWTLKYEDTVCLCAVCADNLHLYLAIRVAYEGEMPKMIRRDFGNIIQVLGDRAWEHHLKRLSLAPV